MTPPDEPPLTAAAAAGDHVHIELTQDERAPAQARRLTRQSLIGWQLPGLVDAVVLAVSELVTNAVRYGRPPLAMELRRRKGRVALAVHDGNPTEPQRSDGNLAAAPDKSADAASNAASDAESGRGLTIVAALADDVHIEQVTGDGKIIHADFDVRPHRSK